MDAMKSAVATAFNRLADVGDTGAPVPPAPAAQDPAGAAPASTQHSLEVIDAKAIAAEELQELEFLDAIDGSCGDSDPSADPVNFEGVPDETSTVGADLAGPLRDGSEGDEGGSESLVSVYGAPVSAERAAELCPLGEGGLVYHAQLVDDKWAHPDHCTPDGKVSCPP